MIINKLTLHNFGIFLGHHELDLSTKKDNGNIILIGGLNGRGKTTILEAILLAFYGRRSPAFIESRLSYSAYLKKFTNNSKLNSYAYVEVSISIPSYGSLTDISIKRSWSITNKIVKDNIIASKNNYQDIYLSENWDTFIEEILPVGISSLFFFDGEKISRIAEEDETSETMQAAIKTLLGIDIVDRLEGDLKKILKNKYSGQENSGLDSELQTTTEEINTINKNIAIIKQKIAHLKTKEERLENVIREKEQVFLKKGGTLKDTRDTLKENQEKLREELYYGKAALINHASGILPLLLNKLLLMQVNTHAKKEIENTTSETILQYIKEYNLNISKLLASLELNEQARNEIVKRLFTEEANLNKKIKSATKIGLSHNAVSLIEDILIQIDNKELLEEITKDIALTTELELKLEQTEKYLLLNNESADNEYALQEIKSSAEKLAKIESELKALDFELSNLIFAKTRTDNHLSKLYKELASANYAEEDTKRIIKFASLSIDKMQEFKKRLFYKKVKTLSDSITASFHHIIGKKSLVNSITINPDNLSLSITNSKGTLMKSQLSAGERQILAVAIMWGLAQTSGSHLPIIIDTPLGRLDSSHRENFLTQYLPYASHQIIVLSTDEEITGKYLNLIEKHIETKYLLDFNEIEKTSNIIMGYFKEKAS